VTKLTDQQKYLLKRIPALYDMNDYKRRTEPAEVKQARRVIDHWEKEEAKLECEARKHNEALVRKAREAIYFDTPEKALSIIQQCERRLKDCPV